MLAASGPSNFRCGFADARRANVRTVETRNVIGKIEGSDAKLKEEAVIFSAHWDHLGVGEAVNGDRIYNGALDNATGCGMLLEIARAWAALPQKPRRSAISSRCGGGRSGLRGSEYYGQHPVIPAGKTAVALNFDSFLPSAERAMSGERRRADHTLSDRGGSGEAHGSHHFARPAPGGRTLLPLRSFFVRARRHPSFLGRFRAMIW